MSTVTITMPSPVASGRTEKSSKKQSKIIVLPLPPSILKRFEPKTESPSVAASPAPVVEEMPQLKKVASQDQPSETNATPAPTQDASTPGATNKKKPSSVNGVKRSTPMPSDNMSKPRGKPGPKKKPRLEDGTIDHSAKPPATGTAAHKLGPKANTGFINANLRALDRSGAPCRRWERKGFHLKSFTGHTWQLASWKGSSNTALANGHSEGSNNDVSMHGSSDRKQSESDTAAGSHTGDHPDRMEITTPAASSPPPPSILAAQPVPIQS